MGKITISKKGNRTFYRVNRRIVCYRDEHKYCMEICERRIYAEMKYQNPVAYNAHRALNALA